MKNVTKAMAILSTAAVIMSGMSPVYAVTPTYTPSLKVSSIMQQVRTTGSTIGKAAASGIKITVNLADLDTLAIPEEQ